MKAWQVHEQGEPRDVMRLADVELGDPAPGILRLRVLSAWVGLPDSLMCRGSYVLTPELPFTPGQELVGEVTAVGEGCVTQVGARVLGVSGFHFRAGSFAQECFGLDAFALPVPDGMSDAEAAAFAIPYHTAWVGLVDRGQLAEGETVLVLGGSGGTGSTAIQLAKALGARVIAVAGGEEKVAFCRECGADEVVDYRSGGIAEGVRAATDGRGVDVVYDPVGGDAYSEATKCIAANGRILLIGFASGRWGQPSAPHMVAHNYSAVGVMPGAGRTRDDALHAQSVMAEHYRAGRLRVPIHRVFPFDEAPLAVEEMSSGRVKGKVVVAIGSS